MWEEAQEFPSARDFIEYISQYHGHYEVTFFSLGGTKCIGGKVMDIEEYGEFFAIIA